MPYILQRSDGAYVAPPRQASSYTPYLQRARLFSTQEAAERERCPSNERVVTLEEAAGQ